jgi:hypothetical protein
MGKIIINSLVQFGEEQWRVIMEYRESSAALANGAMFYETRVWSVNFSGALLIQVHQDEGINSHSKICDEIIRRGAFWECET